MRAHHAPPLIVVDEKKSAFSVRAHRRAQARQILRIIRTVCGDHGVHRRKRLAEILQEHGNHPDLLIARRDLSVFPDRRLKIIGKRRKVAGVADRSALLKR